MKRVIFAVVACLACSVASAQDVIVNGIPWGQTSPTVSDQRDAATSAVSDAMAALASAQGAGGNGMLIAIGYASLAETSVYIARGDAWFAEGSAAEVRNDTAGAIRGYRMAWMCYSNVRGHGERGSRFAASAMRVR
jgi:hypothetical protein